jgi:hypothetical protein
MTAQNLWNLITKFGSMFEICWKLGELKWNFSNNSEVSSYLLRHNITFLKGYDADYWINTNFPINYSFGKNIFAELVNSGGVAGEWLITDEFSTDLDGMGIFVLSKDQTFRICATFLDPAKFFILVIHLTIPKFCTISKDFCSFLIRLVRSNHNWRKNIHFA